MKASKINYLTMRYTFSSETGLVDENRYITKYYIDILGNNLKEEEPVLIGKSEVHLFLLDLALNSGYDLFDLLDTSDAAIDLCGIVYDSETECLKASIEDMMFESGTNNILYLSRLEIFPEYRGFSFGEKVIKDTVNRFSGCCGLVVFKAFPLQLETKDIWKAKMKYNELEQDEDKAKKSLYKYYKSLGFDNIFKDEHFFLIPSLLNEKMDKINLDELFGDIDV